MATGGDIVAVMQRFTMDVIEQQTVLSRWIVNRVRDEAEGVHLQVAYDNWRLFFSGNSVYCQNASMNQSLLLQLRCDVRRNVLTLRVHSCLAVRRAFIYRADDGFVVSTTT